MLSTQLRPGDLPAPGPTPAIARSAARRTLAHRLARRLARISRGLSRRLGRSWRRRRRRPWQPLAILLGLTACASQQVGEDAAVPREAAATPAPAPGAGPATPPLPGYERLVAQFEVAAFGSDFSSREKALTRWTRDITVAARLRGRGIEAGLWARIQEHMAAITRETGIRFAVVQPLRQADLQVYLAPRREFDEALQAWMPGHQQAELISSTSACIAVFAGPQSGEIAWARILIGRDIAEDLRQDCLLEEIVQAMGLPADACHYRPSLFCEADRTYRLGGADAVLLRTLYDPRLRPGMSKAAAMPIARRIIRELWGKVAALAAPALPAPA